MQLDNKVLKELTERLLGLASKFKTSENMVINIMEVCGTHTYSIIRHGLRSILPENIRLISGPGCPVCVTHPCDIDIIFDLANIKDITITSFGDLLNVPGKYGKISDLRAKGVNIKIITSPIENIEISRSSNGSVVFVAVGFETTAPLVAHTLKMAKQLNIQNFFVFNLLKTMPQAIRKVLDENSLNGLICPGHVGAIIGEEPFEEISREARLPMVISGFEAYDLLFALITLLSMIYEGEYGVKNCYTRVVTKGGNLGAKRIINEVFSQGDAYWRGFGLIKESGLELKGEFQGFDAIRHFDLKPTYETPNERACQCGEVIKGRILPSSCPMFNKSCNPSNPKGPCMVSTEGACRAFYEGYAM